MTSSFDLSRLRRGETIVAAAATLLLIFLFVLPWYGLTPTYARTAATLPTSTSVSGWNSLSHLRWLILVTIVVALALAYFQAACRAPATPVSLSVILIVLSLLNVLALLYRVLINVPGPDGFYEQKAGAYLGLLCSLALLYGAYQSLRREGIRPQDGPQEIETVRLGSPVGS